jgi:hypothetical protein
MIDDPMFRALASLVVSLVAGLLIAWISTEYATPEKPGRLFRGYIRFMRECDNGSYLRDRTTFSRREQFMVIAFTVSFLLFAGSLVLFSMLGWGV